MKSRRDVQSAMKPLQLGVKEERNGIEKVDRFKIKSKDKS